MAGDKANKGTFPAFKKLAFGILLTVGAKAIFLTISFTVREWLTIFPPTNHPPGCWVEIIYILNPKIISTQVK